MRTYLAGSKYGGRFHKGFYSRAEKFPLMKILNEKDYKKRNLIFCGHSMGGAVAAIVTIMALVEARNRTEFEESRYQYVYLFCCS